MLHPQLAAWLGRDRCFREIRLTAGFDHPHIVPVLDSELARLRGGGVRGGIGGLVPAIIARLTEQGYRRPLLIVQNDAFNRSRLRTTIALVLTSKVRLVEAPGNVLVPAKGRRTACRQASSTR